MAVLCAVGFVIGVMLNERAEGYEGQHRADRRGLSTWQSYGRVLMWDLTSDDPADLDERRALVDATAAAIIERAELWNRELLTGPLFDLPPADPAIERYEPSAGDVAYLQLTDGSLDRVIGEPIRPHPARVETGELAIIDLDDDVSDYVDGRDLAGVT
jgi:hypothetical protein